jgi:hypothetical protein
MNKPSEQTEQSKPCELANRKPRSIKAFYFGDSLLIVAAGNLPSPCYKVRIEQSLLTVEPPEFLLERCPTGGFCPAVITPYKASQLFQRKSRPKEVVVHHADGSDRVKVKGISEESQFNSLLAEWGSPGDDEATGRSRNLSFEEAFADAHKNLPPRPSPKPDELEVVVVTEIRGEFGGIAGLHDLVVTVRRL